MSAMRTVDLHCGRGSSPLRTKFKTSSRSRSASGSPKKHKSIAFYEAENGVINITTPIKEGSRMEKYVQGSTPKSKTIDDLKESNRSMKQFQRMSKVSAKNTSEKGK